MSLTPRSIALAALAAVLGIIGLWSESLVVPVWKYVCVFLVLGLLYERTAVSRNWPVVSVAGRLMLKLGEKTRLGLVFSNPARRPVQLDYVAALPAGLVGSRENREIAIPAASQSVAEVPVRGVVLGAKNWQTIPARVLGPLGLAHWSRKLPLDAEVIVQPDTLRRTRGKTSSTPQGSESRTLIGAGVELHHLRPYQRGDLRSAIDWKASARSGGLITRVFGEDQHLEVILAIDAGRTSRLEFDGMSQLSHYVNLAARFAEYAVVAEDRAGLVVFADRILHTVPPRRGLQGVRQVRDGLKNLASLPVESNLIEAALKIRELARHRSLVIVLTDLNDRSANSQLARSVHMLLSKHLPIIVGIQSDEVAAMAEGPASTWFDPYKALAAREYQRDVEANIARLRRMGAYAITARPRELGDRVFALYDSLRSKHLI